jgi:hypothetical protein
MKFADGCNFVLQSDALPRKVACMNRTEAEEHLRVIRSLMEKATIYRAISAPTALVGGLASVIAGGLLYARWRLVPESTSAEVWFLVGWGAVLLVTALANTWFLWRDARRRGDTFVSSGMRHALLAMAPALSCGAGLSAFLIGWHFHFLLPQIWMLCYGLALLATRGFAPCSIQRLGWAFLAAGFVPMCVSNWADLLWGAGVEWTDGSTPANLMMVATFGLFHLIYAACTWPRGTTAGAN